MQRIGNAIRRDYYVWLMLSGCRARETMIMETGHVDLDKAVVKFPVTKTSAFTMPISTFMVDLLRNRIADNAKEFGDDCKWVFPSATSETGHLAEAKLTRAEAKLFKNSWSAHVLRHSWITNANEKVGIRPPSAAADQPRPEARQARQPLWLHSSRSGRAAPLPAIDERLFAGADQAGARDAARAALNSIVPPCAFAPP